MPYIGTSPASELANLDINGQKLILDADADTSITSDTDDQIDIEIAGADDFQFTANTFTAQSGSTIAAQALTATTGVFSSDVTGLTLNATGDTAASDNAAIGYTSAEGLILTGQGSTNDVTIKNDADADVLEIPTGTTNVTIAGQLISSDGSEAAPGICFSRDNGAGFFSAESASGAGSNSVNITNDNDATFGVFCFDNGRFILNDATTVNANSAGGITVQQAGYDNEILALKSSDVAHGQTARTETDTFGAFRKYSATQGGALLLGWNESITSVCLRGESVAETDARSTSAEAPVRIDARIGGNFVSADNNIMNIEGASGHTKFIFDSDGDFHADSSSTTFDSYDDAQLARTFDLSHNRGIIASKFDKFISYNHEKLANLEIVGREEDGSPNHFINVTGMQRLHNGAIWQQYEKHENLLNAVYELAVEAVGEDKAKDILDKNDVKLLSSTNLLN